MRMYDIIEKKRDGHELNYDELSYFITGYASGRIPDYQAAALLMAIFIKGMNHWETSDLTELMTNSGDKIDLSSIPGIKVDKHSTGGVGDKVTLIIAPIVASCGVPVAKMSGRGLGHTGGTIDKLESIIGFNTSMSTENFISSVNRIKIAVTAQTGNLAPADKKLYALRDVTATINSIPLIASSIMSKKLASGGDRILLDVKTGHGAFMKEVDESIELAKEMVAIGSNAGKKTAALITDMNLPLGNAIGNSIEVMEAIATLQGHGPEDLQTLAIELAARMLELAEIADIDNCRLLAARKIRDGGAIAKFTEMVENQGGKFDSFDKMFVPGAEIEFAVKSPVEGIVQGIKADSLGKASTILGAGRETKDSKVDLAAGIRLFKKPGMKVQKNEVLATLYTNKREKIREANDAVLDAYTIGEVALPPRKLILAYVNEETVVRY